MATDHTTRLLILRRSPSARYRCDECGEIHRDVDGECALECGSDLQLVDRADLYLFPHRFREARYGGLCDDCGQRRDDTVHANAR